MADVAQVEGPGIQMDQDDLNAIGVLREVDLSGNESKLLCPGLQFQIFVLVIEGIKPVRACFEIADNKPSLLVCFGKIGGGVFKNIECVGLVNSDSNILWDFFCQ